MRESIRPQLGTSSIPISSKLSDSSSADPGPFTRAPRDLAPRAFQVVGTLATI
jgi:hypothetical protein